METNHSNSLSLHARLGNLMVRPWWSSGSSLLLLKNFFWQSLFVFFLSSLDTTHGYNLPLCIMVIIYGYNLPLCIMRRFYFYALLSCKSYKLGINYNDIGKNKQINKWINRSKISNLPMKISLELLFLKSLRFKE